VPAGSGIFTLLGFTGLYILIGLIYVLLLARIVSKGPGDTGPPMALYGDRAQTAGGE
jgi:cytochrome bd-type quinol oxidase subunit 1